MTNQKQDFVATQNVIDVLTANPDLRLNGAQLQALQNNQLVLAAPPNGGASLRGCIRSLRYLDDDKDLVRVVLEKNGQTQVWTDEKIKNLADFRERLQGAADAGNEVNFCVDTASKTMLMLNVYPCKCCTDKPILTTNLPARTVAPMATT